MLCPKELGDHLPAARRGCVNSPLPTLNDEDNASRMEADTTKPMRQVPATSARHSTSRCHRNASPQGQCQQTVERPSLGEVTLGLKQPGL